LLKQRLSPSRPKQTIGTKGKKWKKKKGGGKKQGEGTRKKRGKYTPSSGMRRHNRSKKTGQNAKQDYQPKDGKEGYSRPRVSLWGKDQKNNKKRRRRQTTGGNGMYRERLGKRKSSGNSRKESTGHLQNKGGEKQRGKKLMTEGDLKG